MQCHVASLHKESKLEKHHNRDHTEDHTQLHLEVHHCKKRKKIRSHQGCIAMLLAYRRVQYSTGNIYQEYSQLQEINRYQGCIARMPFSDFMTEEKINLMHMRPIRSPSSSRSLPW